MKTYKWNEVKIGDLKTLAKDDEEIEIDGDKKVIRVVPKKK
jgi:hypothetical protein